MLSKEPVNGIAVTPQAPTTLSSAITFQIVHPRLGWQKGVLSLIDGKLVIHSESGAKVTTIPLDSISKVNRFGIEFSIHNSVNKLTNVAFGNGRSFILAGAAGGLGVAEGIGAYRYQRSREEAAQDIIEQWDVFFKGKGLMRHDWSVSSAYRKGWAAGLVVVAILVIITLLVIAIQRFK